MVNQLNLADINTSMPYSDPSRPPAPWWFSGSDADDAMLNPPSSSRCDSGAALHAGMYGAEDRHARRDSRRVRQLVNGGSSRRS
jgi:hypothetical protein